MATIKGIEVCALCQAAIPDGVHEVYRGRRVCRQCFESKRGSPWCWRCGGETTRDYRWRQGRFVCLDCDEALRAMPDHLGAIIVMVIFILAGAIALVMGATNKDVLVALMSPFLWALATIIWILRQIALRMDELTLRGMDAWREEPPPPPGSQ